MGAFGFAISYAIGSSPPTELDVVPFDGLGRALGPSAISAGSHLYPAGTNASLAALPCGCYAAAWTDYGDDGDGAGVALRAFDPNNRRSFSGAPAHANVTTDFDQVLQDVLWTGTELVVAWSDDSNLTNQLDLKVRTFDATLQPTTQETDLAATFALETSAALAPFSNSWAAAWLAFDMARRRWWRVPVLPTGA